MFTVSKLQSQTAVWATDLKGEEASVLLWLVRVDLDSVGRFELVKLGSLIRRHCSILEHTQNRIWLFLSVSTLKWMAISHSVFNFYFTTIIQPGTHHMGSSMLLVPKRGKPRLKSFFFFSPFNKLFYIVLSMQLEELKRLRQWPFSLQRYYGLSETCWCTITCVTLCHIHTTKLIIVSVTCQRSVFLDMHL